MATFVLIHGSYQGGWIWKPVAERLRAAGHTVYAPTLDGCGERASQVRAGIDTESQADEVAQLLFYEDLDNVVLVGTSSGGMVVCRVAELIPDRIGRLVFVDALALLNGEKIRDIVKRSTAQAGGLTAGPSREDAANRLFADLDPAAKTHGRWSATPSIRSPATSRGSSSTSSGRCRGRPASSGASGRRTPARRTSAAPPRSSTPHLWSSTPATTRC